MPFPQALLALGLVLVIVGVVLAMCTNSPQTMPLFGLGLCLVLGGVGLLITGLCNAMRKLQVAVPGHFLLHPRTGTRFSPHQALAIQRRLDRIRREMSEDSVSRRPEPEPSLPSTPLPWDMEPPPSYDTVMKSQEHTLQMNRFNFLGHWVCSDHFDRDDYCQPKKLVHPPLSVAPLSPALSPHSRFNS